MYIAMVVVLMVVCPAVSVLVEAGGGRGSAGIVFLIGKWFVFWAVGIRLFTAGIRQALQPRFTAERIFGAKNAESYAIVREVGFGNLAMGTLGICSLFRPEWILPAAMVGGLYYGLAGLMHVFRKGRNALEQTAMLTDLFALVVLAVFAVRSWR